mmetsp:Transcript_113964/g.322642  ORF Transcript_113964/g.322642 Transcript_113964/m.322642 type:complete len:403 (-) Transcript_113964:111-1319(-)
MWRAAAASRCSAVVAAALAVALAGGQPPDVESPCDVQELPDRGERGDCAEVLPSGSACQPSCEDGYDVSGPAVCADGNLTMPTCDPSPCNASEAPANGGIGDCPEVLSSGATCQPSCAENFSLAGNSSCYLGNLTLARCLATCPPGREMSQGVCELCPFASFKEAASPYSCQPCPSGANTSSPGKASPKDCTCSHTEFANRTAARDLISCLPCPNNSRTVGGEGSSVEDCQCEDKYLREPKQRSKRLRYCRLPRSCNLGELFAQMNFTGPADFLLKLGTCAPFVRDNETLLPSGQECRLTCEGRLAPQLATDFFTAINLDISCEDGDFTEFPPQGTWCSEASWEVPPLVFLGTVTLAAGIAGISIEVRRYSFEKRCARAMASTLTSLAAGARTSDERKFKLA